MPKGFFTQGMAVLLERPVELGDVLSHLGDFEIARTVEERGDAWLGQPGVVVAMRPEVNGYVVVDIVDEPWPDAMGDPEGEPDLFAAWSMGWFGPFVFPGNLERAVAMSFNWDGAGEAVDKHRSFLRIKSTYVLGADKDALVMPEDYEPIAELRHVTRIAEALLRLPQALAYFNPNGEVLRSLEGLLEDIAWHEEQGVLPLPLWSNVRLFNLEPGWTAMDTVGMEQLDVDDHEACFRPESFDLGDVAGFLRNATEYIREQGPVVQDGDTMDGPNDTRWQAQTEMESLAPRPRTVTRWLPQDGSKPPARLLRMDA